MKVVKRVFLVLFSLAVFIAILSYLDYFLVKTKNSLPKLSIKTDNKEKDIKTYKALFYKVWYCMADGTTIIGDYSDPDPVCPNAYNFKDGYYTNSSGLKISQRDTLLMIDKNIYTHEMIDIMTTTLEVSNAVYVSEHFGKTIFKTVDSKKGTVKGESKEYSLVVFPTFKKEGNTYKWNYNTEDETNYYCISNNSTDESAFSKYTNGNCEKTFEPLRPDEKWCSLYQNSTLVYNEKQVGNLCKE